MQELTAGGGAPLGERRLLPRDNSCSTHTHDVWSKGPTDGEGEVGLPGAVQAGVDQRLVQVQHQRLALAGARLRGARTI